MNKILRLCIVTAILLIALIGLYLYAKTQRQNTIITTKPSPTSSMEKIIFPKGEEALIAGQKYTLQWTPGSGQTQIFLIDATLESQGASVSIVDRVYNIENSGQYTYTVPKNLKDGEYKFEIGNLKSNYFYIVSSKDSIPFCDLQNLQATLSLSPGAGNVYGTFTLKNTSSQTCQIAGNNFVTPSFDKNSVKNIVISHVGQTQTSPFKLSPNQILYSQVHYPNGPQCTSTKTTLVTFIYVVSPYKTVTFATSDGHKAQPVTTCKTATEMTTIQIWNMSTVPITP